MHIRHVPRRLVRQQPLQHVEPLLYGGNAPVTTYTVMTNDMSLACLVDSKRRVSFRPMEDFVDVSDPLWAKAQRALQTSSAKTLRQLMDAFFKKNFGTRACVVVRRRSRVQRVASFPPKSHTYRKELFEANGILADKKFLQEVIADDERKAVQKVWLLMLPPEVSEQATTIEGVIKKGHFWARECPVL